ncbi:MAG: metallophosphoesterase family protein [Thermomicrobiales bacterium]|nr:metallophosphoesterase family protein [Thermomicrobiales bacterium]
MVERRPGATLPPIAFPVPLTVGVISDTHINARSGRQLPPEVFDLFRRLGVDLILHAGDLNTLGVVEALERVAPTLAVRGNSDDVETRRMLPARVDFTIGARRFVLIHGDAGPSAVRTAEALVGKADCVVFGHSHMPRIDLVGETLLFNPGSPTDKRWWPDYSVGLLRVTENGIAPELIVFRAAADLNRIRE